MLNHWVGTSAKSWLEHTSHSRLESRRPCSASNLTFLRMFLQEAAHPCVPDTCVRNLDWVSGSWFWPDTAQAVASLYGNQTPEGKSLPVSLTNNIIAHMCKIKNMLTYSNYVCWKKSQNFSEGGWDIENYKSFYMEKFRSVVIV